MDDLHERLREMRELEDRVVRLRRILDDRRVEERRAAETARHASDEALRRQWMEEDIKRLAARQEEDRRLEATRANFDPRKDVQKAKAFISNNRETLEKEFRDLQRSVLEPHSRDDDKPERATLGSHLDQRSMKQVLDEAFQTVDKNIGSGDGIRPSIYLRSASPADGKELFDAKQKFLQGQRDFDEKVRRYDQLSQHPEVRRFLEKIQPETKQAEADALRRREANYHRKDILDLYSHSGRHDSFTYPTKKYADGDWGVRLDVSAGAIAAEQKASAITNFERLPLATQWSIQDLVAKRTKDLDALKALRDKLTTQLEAAKERVANRGLLSRAYHSVAEDKDAALIKNVEARLAKLRNVDPGAETRQDERKKLDHIAGALNSGALDRKANKPEKDGHRWYIHDPALNQKVAELKNEASTFRDKADDLIMRANAKEQTARELADKNSARLSNDIADMLDERAPSPDALEADARRFEDVEAEIDQLHAEAAELRQEVPQLRKQAEDLETRSVELLHENRGKGAHLVSDVTTSLTPKSGQEEAAERIAKIRASKGQSVGQAAAQSERTVRGGDKEAAQDSQQSRDPKEDLAQVQRNRQMMEERERQQQAQWNRGRG